MSRMATTTSRCHRRALNSILQRISRRERYIVGTPRIPFGVSLIVVARHCRRYASAIGIRYHPPVRISSRRGLAEAAGGVCRGVRLSARARADRAFTRELGVCESGAVRDVLAGNIILPYFIPGPMVHVPPLYWWTAALGVHAFGWTRNRVADAVDIRGGARPAQSSSCGPRWRLNRRIAFWAAASLLLCHFFLDAARQPRMDSMLALFVTAAAIAFERALRPAGSATSPPATRATLAANRARARRTYDGPRNSDQGRSSEFCFRAWSPGSISLFADALRDLFRYRPDSDLSSSPWRLAFHGTVAAYQVGGQKFLQWQLAMNLWSRFIPAEAGGAGYCAHPFWYFTPHTLSGFIPWTVYLPALAIYVWPRRGRELPEPVVFTLCWFAAIFVFFSTSHGKCLVYILPAFPPLAILTGIAIDAAVRLSQRSEIPAEMPATEMPPPAPPSSPARDRAFSLAFAIATAIVAAAGNRDARSRPQAESSSGCPRNCHCDCIPRTAVFSKSFRR